MDRKVSLNKHISEMVAVEKHILAAIEQQRDDDNVKGHVETNKLVIKIERVLNEHVTALEALAKQYDAKTESVVKEALTKALGVVAGLYDKVRGDQPLSRDLRDDYTALSLAAMGYTSFHTYGLTIGEERIATLASQHLKDLTPLMVEISKVLPAVVAKEIKEQSDFDTDTSGSVVSDAVSNTQKAWSPEVTESANV